MEKALKNVPESFMEPPEGLVTVKIQGNGAGDQGGKGVEWIYRESLPPVPLETDGESPQKMTIPPPSPSG